MTRWDDQKGFSLLEVLIGLSVFTVVLFAVYTSFIASQRTLIRGEDKIEVQQTGRVAMGMVAREIRTAGYDPSNPPVIPGLASPTAIQVADANTLTFIADVDGDNVTDQVTYRLQGTQVIRDFASWIAPTFPAPVTEQLADGVTAFTFTYFDGNDPNNEIAAPVPPASLADIRRITIGLSVQETGVGGQQTLTLTMDVRLRNVQASGAPTYQFTDKDKNVLTRDFTKALAPGALAALDIKLASDVPGATPPASCPADCYAYDPNGGDPASVDPATLGYVGGLDSSNYGSGIKLENLVLQ